MTTQQAVDYYGSVRALSLALGITTQAVYAWGDVPPMAVQYALQVKTVGVLKASEAA